MKTNMKVKGIVIGALIMASMFAFSAPASASYTYDGYEVKNMINGTIQGDIFAGYGDRHGLADGRIDGNRNGPYRTNYSVPNGNGVKWARLFVGVWGGRAVNCGWLNTTLNASGTLHYLGNVTIGNCSTLATADDDNPTYNQTVPSIYGTGNGNWMVAYNVTNNVSLNAWNNVTATTYTCPPTDLDGRIYGITLVVVYENTSLAKVQYWINEGNVNLNYITPLNNTVTRFNGTAYNSTVANLTVVYYTGTANENDYLFLNAPNDTSTSPGNVSQSNIGWDNGSTYWRYQMDNKNIADERVDSCSGSGCCCDDNSINSYAFDFNCFSKTNDSNYMVRDIINTSAANSNYAIFWRGRDDNGNGIIDSTWAASGVEGEAYLHPIVAVLKLTNITHVYDFSTGAGVNKWAFRYQVDAKPPNTNGVPNTEFTPTQYGYIKTDNEVYQSDQTGTNGYYAAHRFNFSIDETNPEKINVTWIGKGWHDSGGTANGAYLYIYNFSATSAPYYDELDNNSGVGTDATLTGENASAASNYVNGGNVTVLVVQKTEQLTPELDTYASHIETDYVKLVVTP